MGLILRFFRFLLFLAGLAVFLIGIAMVALPLPGHIPVLMYHFVGTEEDARTQGNYVSEQGFAKQLSYLEKFGFRVISLDEYYAIRTGRQKPRGKQVVITFDDGDISFATKAVPILTKYKYPVTQFLVSDRVNGVIKGGLELEELKKLKKHSWVNYQAHSKTHANLTTVSETQLEDELIQSKRDLEAMFGTPFDYLAYPFANVNTQVVKVTERAGYKLAFASSYKKLKGLDVGPFTLPRVKITGSSDNPVTFWFYLSGIYDGFKYTREKIKKAIGYYNDPANVKSADAVAME